MAVPLAAIWLGCSPTALNAAAAEPTIAVESPAIIPAAGPGAGDNNGSVLPDAQAARSELAAPEQTAAPAPGDGQETTAVFGGGPAADGAAPTGDAGSAGPATEFSEPGADPIAAWKEALIEDTGLLARQSEISESILLIERQIRRAELLGRLLALVGPDAAIETAPGVFEHFGDTPAGRRIAAEMAENELDTERRLLELRLEILRSGTELARHTSPPPTEAVPVPDAATVAPPPTDEPGGLDQPVLEEISGFAGTRSAVFRLGSDRVRAEAGDILPNGAKVVAIEWDAAELELDGRIARRRIGR